MLGNVEKEFSDEFIARATQWIIMAKGAIAKLPNYSETKEEAKPALVMAKIEDTEPERSIKYKNKIYSVVENRDIGDYCMMELLRRGKRFSVAIPKGTIVERLF